MEKEKDPSIIKIMPLMEWGLVEVDFAIKASLLLPAANFGLGEVAIMSFSVIVIYICFCYSSTRM